MTRYVPGYTGPKLPAAPSRPGVKQTVTGTRPPPPVIDPKPMPLGAGPLLPERPTVQPRGTPRPNQNPNYTGPGIKKEAATGRAMKKGGMVKKNKPAVKKMAEGGAATANKGMSKKQTAKVSKVMKEFKEGTLHSGKKGPVVKDKGQAIAIALSQARRAKKK
jgi:hypothetical protein